MKRILLLITDLQIGGTPTVVRELAVRLSAAAGQAARLQVACLSPWGPVADQIAAAGVPVTALGARGAADLPRTVWRLARLLQEQHIDTVFSFLLHANATAALGAAFVPHVRLIQAIQTSQPTPRWHWPVQALVQHLADCLVVPSPSVAQAAQRWALVPQTKLRIIPNAIDPASLAAATARARTGPWTSVGFIGRLDPIKRVDDLLEAMALLTDPVRLHIFGDGPERPALMDQTRRLGLTGRIIFHGIVPVAQATPQIDVLALPSLAEGFPMVLLEAMAAGVPIVASNAPGIRDVVTHEQTALLVSPRSPAVLAAAIHRLLSDTQLRGQLSAAAHALVQSRYTWPRILPAYQDLLGI
jgi:glycosyltransferase involved in cell wall biosynthesis